MLCCADAVEPLPDKGMLASPPVGTPPGLTRPAAGTPLDVLNGPASLLHPAGSSPLPPGIRRSPHALLTPGGPPHDTRQQTPSSLPPASPLKLRRYVSWLNQLIGIDETAWIHSK